MKAGTVYARLGLSRNPFPPTPDAGSYFFTSHLEEDFAEIVHCIEARKGFVLLTGEVGLGKSTMVRRLLDTLQGKKCHSALILNTFLQDGALLSAIQMDFGLAPNDSVEQGLEQLTQLLIARHQAGEISLLVIDDAQNLSVQSLELVRLLCNLETNQEKLLQILLAGQPELEHTLARPELRQLKSRIVKHARLTGLHKSELARYFDFRVNAADGEGRLSLDKTAADLLHRVTGGNLRQLHLLLDRCLYGLAAQRGSVVNAELVRRAVAELPSMAEASLPRPQRRKAWTLAGLAAGVALVAGLGVKAIPWESALAGDGAAAKPALAAPVAVASLPAPAGTTLSDSPAYRLLSPHCQKQLEAVASAGSALHLQPLPESLAARFSPHASSKACAFVSGSHNWLAWLGSSESRLILAAQQVTRTAQEKLKKMGLMDQRALDDGLFGPRTEQAFALFQQLQGLPPTGKPDDLTFFLLEHQDVPGR